MTTNSDIVINASKFRESIVSEEAKEFNKKLAVVAKSIPPWYAPEVGISKFRAMRAAGGTAFPKPLLLDDAYPFSIPSRDAGRSIPCRVVKPEGAPIGVFLHVHGGGWVLADEHSQDVYLKNHCNNTGVLAISIGYRLAPENPYPAGPHDCYDVAEWLIQNAEKEFGAPLKFMGGESAGGHLTALTTLHLLAHSNPVFSNFRFKGLILHFGVYDLSKTPSYHNVKDDPILSQALLDNFWDAFLPDKSINFKDPAISPLYFDFSSLPSSARLPPAFFSVGTADRLVDDTIFMSAKWQVVGGEAVVKIVPGAPHGYIAFPAGICPGVKETLEAVYAFMNEKL